VHADLWFKNAVVYSLNVETFLDANGDGCGDLEGLSRKLDYLNGLGVDTLWLSPFQPTPGRDDGYDITDHLGVDRRFGTSGDFVEFMHEAGSRGMRVIVDLVVNHTSDRHPWFKDARSSRDAARHDWYVWSDKRPPDWDIGMVFPGVQQETWSYERRVRRWYFHRFYDFEPDLNMSNPVVREEIRRIIGYWLELGVAGFRVDAVPFVLEKPSVDGGKARLQFDWLHDIREFLQWRTGNAALLGEANVMPEGTARRGERHARRGAEVFRRRRRAAHDVQLLGEPASVRRTRHRRCAAAWARPATDRRHPAGHAVGPLPAKP
jgi:maltose alpha-D-glucosyltransferase/alpha-amylase